MSCIPYTRTLWYFKELFFKKYLTVKFENTIQFWKISKNVRQKFQKHSTENFVTYVTVTLVTFAFEFSWTSEKWKLCYKNLFWKNDTRTTFSLIELRFLKYCWLPRKFMQRMLHFKTGKTVLNFLHIAYWHYNFRLTFIR